MNLWRPKPGEVELLDWWRPFFVVARLAREDGFPWPVVIDDFRLLGRVRRSGRLDVWVYTCRATGGELRVDDGGTTYKFIPTPNARGIGQLRPTSLRSALWQAGVPASRQPEDYEPLPEPRAASRPAPLRVVR